MKPTAILRKWQLTDKVSLAEQANNIRVWNYLRDYFPYPYEESDAEAFIQMVLDKPDPATDFSIEWEGKAVGGIGIIPRADVERISAEMGYWLGENYWNRGIMTHVVKQMSEYVFTHFPITKLYATIFEFNIASMRVLEKAGFTREGILRQAAIKNGKTIDLHYYGLLKP